MYVPPRIIMSLDEVISRRQWGARLPRKLAPALHQPIESVAFVYTETEDCTTKEECIKVMQRLQNYHIDRGMYDIPYNFILGGDFNIYEGRGWKTTVPVPPDIEELPDTSLVVARLGPISDDYERRADDFTRGFDVIHFGHLKLFIDPSMSFRCIYYDWNRHEVLHGFKCDKPWPSMMKALMKMVPGYMKFIQQ